MNKHFLSVLLLAFTTQYAAAENHRLECVNAMFSSYNTNVNELDVDVAVKEVAGPVVLLGRMSRLINQTSFSTSNISLEVTTFEGKEVLQGQMTQWIPMAQATPEMKSLIDAPVDVTKYKLGEENPAKVQTSHVRFIVDILGNYYIEQKTASGKIYADLPYGTLCQRGIQRAFRRALREEAKINQAEEEAYADELESRSNRSGGSSRQ